MNKDKIKAVIDLVPELTDHGINIYDHGRGLSQQEKTEEFTREQELLLNSSVAFQKTVEWLEQVSKIKTFNHKHSSYELKHLAEKHIGYITNGVFIAAAIHAGFKYKINPTSPNVIFNMSEESLKGLEKK